MTENSKNEVSINAPLSYENTSTAEILNNILQQQLTWNAFNIIYPQYEITAQSSIQMNVKIPEFKNVIFVFGGNLNDNISEYKMVSINAAGDVLLPEHYGKTFDQIVEEEDICASYVLSDDLVQHLYKYEEVYIYRDNYYYYIRGFIHLNELTSNHIAILLYSENCERPW